MDVKTICVAAVAVGTAAFLLYEYLFSNEANYQQAQYSYGPERRTRPRENYNFRNNNFGGNRRNNRMERKDEQCTICMTSLLRGFSIQISCNHQFHHKCLSDWINIKPECPLCRKTIAIDEI